MMGEFPEMAESTLSTIGLTITAVLGISLITGAALELGLTEAEVYLLLFTLLVTVVNFTMERTNVLHGLVHLVLFLTYIDLIFDRSARPRGRGMRLAERPVSVLRSHSRFTCRVSLPIQTGHWRGGARTTAVQR